MTATPSLTLRGQRLDAAALGRLQPGLAASENEQAALDFCRDWLNGEATFMVTTSGSTGAPQPVDLTRAQMEASAHATAAALSLRPGMRSLVCLPARFIAGRMMLARGLVLGLEMHLVEPAADPLAALPPGAPIDFAAFIPLQIETLLQNGRRPAVDDMHAVLVGGAPISRALDDALAPLRAAVYHTYGMTETATHVALRRLSGPKRSPLFRLLPGVAARLDERGCLALCGPMTRGMWVQTNDLVRLEADACFVWLGRADNVINTGGVKVAIEPLEAVLESLLPELVGEGWPRRFAVVGLPDDRLGSQVALLLEGAPLPTGVEAALLAALRTRLGPFEAPRRILYAARFSETPTGKIDRAATLRAAT